MNDLLGYTVLVDVTARDIQNEAKKQGMPWAIAKGFDTFAPTGPRIVDAKKLNPANLDLWLKINGAIKQQGNTRDMIHPVGKLIAYISQIMTLEPHDIIATGTPEGIGPMKHGDFVEASIDGIGILEFTVQKDKE
jgi:2-keto-4-pentenoate hydratase/2-oxohepta-3-ene-1,7-dioic acid hydratase in catechol pathway